MRTPQQFLALSFGVLLLVSCASSPSWKGMSENEIAAWRSLGVEAGDAQAYSKAGLGSSDVEAWRAAGLSGRDAILAWTRSGWTPATAQPWLERQFDLDTAVAWYKKKFTASQARSWVDGGFSLREAIDNRSKGLAPVK